MLSPMEVLASRLILHPSVMARSRHFYEQVLGLRIFHEYGDGSSVIGVVYFLGGGFLELSGAPSGRANGFSTLWLLHVRKRACEASAFPSLRPPAVNLGG